MAQATFYLRGTLNRCTVQACWFGRRAPRPSSWQQPPPHPRQTLTLKRPRSHLYGGGRGHLAMGWMCKALPEHKTCRAFEYGMGHDGLLWHHCGFGGEQDGYIGALIIMNLLLRGLFASRTSKHQGLRRATLGGAPSRCSWTVLFRWYRAAVIVLCLILWGLLWMSLGTTRLWDPGLFRIPVFLFMRAVMGVVFHDTFSHRRLQGSSAAGKSRREPRLRMGGSSLELALFGSSVLFDIVCWHVGLGAQLERGSEATIPLDFGSTCGPLWLLLQWFGGGDDMDGIG